MQRIQQIKTDNGQIIPVFIDFDLGGILPKVTDSKIFKNWFGNLTADFGLQKIIIQSVDMFGSRVGFIKMQVHLTDRQGNIYDRVVFLRGGAVACFTVFHCENKYYGVFVRQPRVPTSIINLLEMPAGMLDDSSDPRSVMVDELQQELGLDIDPKELFDVTAVDLGINSKGYYLSPGLLDESIYLFLLQLEVSREKLEFFQGKKGGLVEENEDIVVDIIPLSDMEAMQEVKKVASTRVALALYNEYKNNL